MPHLLINFWSNYNDCKTTDSGAEDSVSWAKGWRSLDMAEYHDPDFMLLYVINNIFRDIHEKNGVTRDIIARVIII